MKAIEFHLTTIFAKLIRTRREIRAALQGGPESVGFDSAEATGPEGPDSRIAS